MTINQALIAILVRTLLLYLNHDTLTRAMGGLLTLVEDAVNDSNNPLDDQLLLPLCAKLRVELNLPRPAATQ